MRIAIGGDHAAESFKEELKQHVGKMGHDIVDYGAFPTDPPDYPIVAERAALAVSHGECDCGLLFCGTGQGMMLTANKVRGIRCAVCSDCYSASMVRAHNDANMMALGARVLGVELAKMIVDVFLNTPFEGGRHARRVNLMMGVENRAAGGQDHL